MYKQGKIIKLIFFGNYFVGLLAILLSIEACLQLSLPLPSISYLVLLFIAPTVYYTYAYTGSQQLVRPNNQRAIWYRENKLLVKCSQVLLLGLSVILFIYLMVRNRQRVLTLPFDYWGSVIIVVLVGLLYYGLLPKSFYKLNLRNKGWLKAFVIGFVWACCANVLLLVILKIELGIDGRDLPLWIWLFVKNWMFCTVNAIMFDIKDYPTDANRDLRTFVVRYGLRKTIFYTLIPLLFVGLASLLIFANYREYKTVQMICNVLPFLATVAVAYSMRKRRPVLYYLMVIDGLILFKACCGIIGILIFNGV